MGYWKEITTSNATIDDLCGQNTWLLEHALDCDGQPYPMWNCMNGHTHWFVLDLGSTHHITKVRSYSDMGCPDLSRCPTDVDIYITNDKNSWGTAVATNISSWHCASSYIEEEITPKSGRYIKFIINDTAYPTGYLRWGGDDDDTEPGSIVSIYVSQGNINTTSSITLSDSYTTYDASTVSSIYIESDLLEGAKRWYDTNEYTVIDGVWKLTGYHTARAGYTAPNQSVSSFRSECMTGNTVTCSQSTIENNWLNPGNLGAIWWDLTDDERWGISSYIIETWDFYRYDGINHHIIDYWSYGDPYCESCDNDWSSATCAQNQRPKYGRMGDAREIYYQYSQMYFKNPEDESEEEILCFHNQTSWNLPVHPVSVPTGESGYHAILAFQVCSDPTDWGSWRFFQYESNDIQPGGYQMDGDGPIYIWFYHLPYYEGPNEYQYGSGWWEFDLDGENVTYTQTVDEEMEGPTVGSSQIYGGALYQVVDYYPWDNKWLYIGEILNVTSSITIGGTQIQVPTSITLSGYNSADTVSSITIGGNTYTVQANSSIYIYETPLYEHCGSENDLVIGCNFDGQVKYARVYNECLTSDQVKRNSQGNINYNDLVAWWDMTEGTGTTLYNKKDSDNLTGTITGATWSWTTNQLHASSWNITRCRGNTFDNATINISPVYMDYKTGDEIQLYNDTTSTTIWSGFLQHRGRIGSDGLVTLEAIGLGSDIAYKKVTLDLTSKSPEYILTQALAQVAGSKGRTYTLSTPVASGITIANYSIDDTLNRVIGEMIDRTGYTLRWTPDYTVYFEPTGNSSSGDTIDSSSIGTIFEEWIPDNPESLINKVQVDGEGLVDGDWENYSGDYSHDASIAMYGEHYLHVKVDYLSSDEEAGDLAEMLIRVNPTPGGSVVLPFSHLDWSDICNKTVTLIDELRQINGTYTVYSQTFNSDGTTRLTVGRDPETHWIDRARERNAIGAARALLMGSSSRSPGGSSNSRNMGMGGGVSSGYSSTGISGGVSSGASNTDVSGNVSDGTQNSSLLGYSYTNSSYSTGGITGNVSTHNGGSGNYTIGTVWATGYTGEADGHSHSAGTLRVVISSHQHSIDHTHGDTFAMNHGLHSHTIDDNYSVQNPSHGHGDSFDTNDYTHPHGDSFDTNDYTHPHGDSFVVDPSSHDHTITIDEVTVTDLTKSDR